ncbi:Golgin subfamily A member 7/ERF4 family-domain-containing protein [Pisolithus thermaeus]|nr:Golgin subfamily A member 7/ERF4 family-domain-containing protein [Pisolithus thermaeus]
MTAGLRRTQSKKLNRSRGDGRGNSPGEGNGHHPGRNGVVENSVVIDIRVAHPVIPPRTSSLAWHVESKGSMANSTISAATNRVPMPCTVRAEPPPPPLPSTPNHVWDVVTTSANTTTDSDSTSNSITIHMEDTFSASDSTSEFPGADAPPTASPPPPPPPPPIKTPPPTPPLPLLVTSRPSPGSSQASLAASHSSAKSLAAGPSSLATSWACEGNVDNDDPGEGGVGSELEMNAEQENIVRSREVIDLVGGEEGEGEQEQRQPQEEALIPHTALPAPGTPGTKTEGESDTSRAVLTGDDRVASPKDTAAEEDIVDAWHPLSSHPLLDERDHSFDPDDDQINDPPVKDVETRRRSVQFSEDCSSETDEKKRPMEYQRASLKLSASEKLEQLKLKLRSPPSPQPWDLGRPPEDSNSRGLGGGMVSRVGGTDRDQEGNEHLSSDYYSTLNSKNFTAMQKSRQRTLIPHSSYYFGPPPPGSAYGTAPVGHIGVHHPREIVRIERDYTGGEVIQFSPVYPLELEGRITPTQFHETINNINEILISAYSLRHSFVYNVMAVATLQLSTLVATSHYTKEMRRLERKVDELNTQLYNPVGLNILWPRKVAFLFLEIEYY